MAVRPRSDNPLRPDFGDVPSQRRRNMAAIKGRNTRPEQLVRSLLHQLGYRFRLHRRDLPGRPDVVLPGRRKVLLIHGCFWHRHGCRNSVLPKTRREWWEAKLRRNVVRDRQNLADLSALGWTALVLWECELVDRQALIHRICAELGPSKRAAERM